MTSTQGETASNNFPLIIIVREGGAKFMCVGSNWLRAGGKSARPDDTKRALYNTVAIFNCRRNLYGYYFCHRIPKE
ncbi:hypothetical protein ANTQUA_LOCUS6220 [Anthophora quadrimaculata]